MLYGVIKSLKKKHLEKVASWLYQSESIQVDYQDETSAILDKILKHASLPESKAKKIIMPVPGFNNISALHS